jgi:hypothetical protein
MYKSLTTKTTLAQVASLLNTFTVQQEPDGLTLVPPQPDLLPAGFKKQLDVSPLLFEWLIGLRLLRVPLSYLIPDPRLLPPESIRFFNVDRTWTDRLVDGALIVGHLGTVDQLYTYMVLEDLRGNLDKALADIAEQDVKDIPGHSSWDAANGPISGMLIRSELIKRWPDLVVEAFGGGDASQRMGLLRRETISPSVLIALFAGVPARVEVREPHVGMRFGFEGSFPGPCTLKLRKIDWDDASIVETEQHIPVTIPVTFLNDSAPGETGRGFDAADLVDRIGKTLGKQQDLQTGGAARALAINLEQPAWKQIFHTEQEAPESSGWRSLASMLVGGTLQRVQLSRGRSFSLDSHAARLLKPIDTRTP